jgi:hypothetical protein
MPQQESSSEVLGLIGALKGQGAQPAGPGGEPYHENLVKKASFVLSGSGYEVTMTCLDTTSYPCKHSFLLFTDSILILFNQDLYL